VEKIVLELAKQLDLDKEERDGMEKTKKTEKKKKKKKRIDYMLTMDESRMRSFSFLCQSPTSLRSSACLCSMSGAEARASSRAWKTGNMSWSI
jgi:hypothetical protein